MQADGPIGAIARLSFSGRRRTRRSGSRTGRSAAPTGTSSACTTLGTGSPGASARSARGAREIRGGRARGDNVQRVPSPVLCRDEAEGDRTVGEQGGVCGGGQAPHQPRDGVRRRRRRVWVLLQAAHGRRRVRRRVLRRGRGRVPCSVLRCLVPHAGRAGARARVQGKPRFRAHSWFPSRCARAPRSRFRVHLCARTVTLWCQGDAQSVPLTLDELATLLAGPIDDAETESVPVATFGAPPKGGCECDGCLVRTGAWRYVGGFWDPWDPLWVAPLAVH